MHAWDADRWHAATAQLDALLDLPLPDREARLDALRARDARLADDVAGLLRDHDAADAKGFLEEGAGELLTVTAGADGSLAVRRGPLPAALPPGSSFGAYRILRILGRGGMGVVYEAEEAESGRHVALKVLQQRLDDERERERFAREGRLAASIDHEHCVFVFGASDVQGRPAIAMELMQGTLADRLAATGPIAPGAAVDIALQLIAGLEAAAEAGILHRDVKPSNCFVDGAGVVKIGDFGISRSVRPTEETALSMRGQLTGTPTYAPPEQLRGAALDVRADIYSLGATLYELVTGRRPFEAQDLMALLMAVANDVPAAPHTIAPAVPPGLSQVILRCLAKRPEDRFSGYDGLVRALAPYQSVAPTPATLGRRFVAGALDHLVVTLLILPVSLMAMGTQLPTLNLKLLALAQALSATITVTYWGLSEGIWRRTLGKALLGLTVVDTAGRPARSRACWARAALYVCSTLISGFSMFAVWSRHPEQLLSGSPWVGGVATAMSLGVLALLFSTGRRRNGYAAIHDLATGTRVVEQRVIPVAARLPERHEATRGLRPTTEIRGEFAVLQGEVPGRSGWRPGIDDRLRRPVWIRDVPEGTVSISAARASLARPTRLRWLAGRRAGQDNWDVFEGIAGAPLTRVCAVPTSWVEARGWLIDLAQELAAHGPGDRPPLGLDRVWVLDTGRVKLLDDPALDMPRDDTDLSSLALLRDAVRTVRSTSAEPWPVGAERLRQSLDAGSAGSVTDVARDLEALGRRLGTVSHGRRALTLMAMSATPVIIAIVMALSVTLMRDAFSHQRVDDRIAAGALIVLRNAGPTGLSSGDRDRIETILATRYRTQLTDPTFFDPRRFLLLTPEHKAIADRILHRPPDEAPAAGPPPPALRDVIATASAPRIVPSATELALFMIVSWYLMFSLFALVIAPIARGGALLKMFGLELVTDDGRRASRLRVLARAAITWSPFLLLMLILLLRGGFGSHAQMMSTFAGTVLVATAGAAVAIAQPARGIQDRLAGTWIVPR